MRSVRIGKRLLLSVLAASLAGLAQTAPRAVPDDGWDLSPLAWNRTGDRVSSTGFSDLAFARPDASEVVVVEAELTPLDVKPGAGWPVAGLVVGLGERDYWHLAFVQPPASHRAGRLIELAEMRDGSWLAQEGDGLRTLPGGVPSESWCTNVTYRFRLEATQESVVGTVRDAAGKIVFRKGYGLTDRPAVKGGRAGLRASEGFKCAFAQVCASSSGRTLVTAKDAFPPYASDSFVKGIESRATGFFRVERKSDGKWWVIDPLGRGTVIFGVDHVRWEGHATVRVQPPRRHYLEHNTKAYPDRAAWEEETLARLKQWGFNLLGAGSNAGLSRRGLVHAKLLGMGEKVAADTMPRDWYICPNEHRPCSALPNMFHPDFGRWCDHFARRKCTPLKDDPWLVGYFIDNELAWWGRGDRQTGLWDSVLKLAADHSARRALAAYCAERGIADPARATMEQKSGFVRLAAQKYFSLTTGAIRRHDPNHMVLGSRMPGVWGAPDVVWEEAGRHCDIVTMNSYPFVDLDRGTVHNSSHERATPLTETYAAVQARVKRPMMITEWSFPALDSGLPCTSGAGQRFHTQKERAEATRLYAQTLLSLPYMVGYDYFMWVDEPPEGISDAFPEDSNYGLVSEKGVPYRELVQVFTELQTDIGAARNRPVPAPKPARLRETGWDGPSLAHWQVNGKDVGDFGVMLSYVQGGSRRWVACRRIKSCVKAKLPDGELWTLVGEGAGADGARFEITHTLRFTRGCNHFLATVVAVRNVGRVKLGSVEVFFRTIAPYALEVLEDYSDGQNVWCRRKKGVPNLWKGPKKGCWLARDGRYIGVTSTTDAAGSVNYVVDRSRQSQHPDAVLHPTDAVLDLAPGETHVSDGRLWFHVLGGTDGDEGWLKTSAALEKRL